LHYWCAAPTYAIGKVQQAELFDALGGQGSPFIRSYKRGERELTLNGGSYGDMLIEFKTTQHPETLVAAGLDGVWLDEAARAKEEAWLGGLRERLTDRKGWALFSTTPLGRNWFFNEIVEKARQGNPDYSCHSWFTSDNTAIPDLVAEVEKARRDLPDMYFRREYEASFDAFVGQIYTGFKYHVHVTDKRPDPKTIIETRYGVDWGYKNPGAILVFQKTGDGLWFLQEEVVKSGVLVSGDSPETWVKIALRLRDKWGEGRFITDHDAEKVAQFRKAGLKPQLANKEVLPGIEYMAKLFELDNNGKPRYLIHSSNKVTIKETAAYQWRDTQTKEEPLKEDDHTKDAERYALFTEIKKAAYY
jgi:phage terminase large subunit